MSSKFLMILAVFASSLGISLAQPAGLVAAYGFNEGAGTALGDASGNGNTGAIQGAAWTTGRFGQALSFNGISAMVVVNDSAPLDLTAGMTLEAWVFRAPGIPAWRDIIYKAADMYYLMGASETRGGAPAMGGTFGNNLYGLGPLPTNTWIHLAATYDGAVMRFYTNGVQIGSQAETGPIQTSAGALTIGGDDLGGQFWTGRIDEVRIYNRALSAGEIVTDMNTPVGSAPVNQPPVVAANGNPTSGAVPLTVAFSSAGSSDPEGVPLTYSWVFGDGNTSTAANPDHTYNTAGNYVARLTVSDGVNSRTSGDINISANNPGNQPPVVAASASPLSGEVPLSVAFSSAGSSDPEGVPLTYSWVFGDGNSSTAANPGHTYSAAGTYVARLTVSDGVNSATSSDINISVTTPPAGGGLVAAYGFNEGAGTTLGDASGNGNAGNIQGATWITGRFGQALSFNGSSAMVAVNDSPSLDLTTGMTLEAWVLRAQSIPAWRDIIYKAADIYYLMGSSETRGGAPALGGAFGENLYGLGPLPTNAWVHLAATYDGAVMRFYTNSVLIGSQPAPEPMQTSGLPLTMGGDDLGGQFWSGRIDEVRIYNRALTAGEIQTDMNTPVGSAPVNQSPVVAASGSPLSGVVPLTVAFSSAGSSDPEGVPLTYSWVFGDGNLSTAANPNHTYNAAGTYLARLTVSDGVNSRTSSDISITATNPVNQPPFVAASGNPLSGDAPLTVSFSSAGSADPEGVPLTYSWVFGDGNISTAASPSHTYNAAGTYTARLTVSDGVHSRTSSDISVTANNPANQPPVVVASGNPLSGLAPLTVAFSSAGSSDPEGVPLTYSWIFGDGNTSTAENPNHTYNAAGTFAARLTVSDGVNSRTSSDISITVTNPVNQPPVVAASGDPLSGLVPLTVAFSSAGSSDPEGVPLTYSWVFGDGNTSTAANPNHTYNSAGTFAARLAVSDGVNSSTSSVVSITATNPVNQPPIASASGNPLSGIAPLTVAFSSSGSSDPEGVPLTYSWTFGDGNISTAANPNHTYGVAGTYVARLTVSDGVNSRTATDLNISVLITNQPSARFVNEVVVPDIISAVTIAFLPGGRMLVGELIETIWIVQPGANQADATPVLQMTGSSFIFGEQGLMDIAVDPNFAQNGYFYVYYTRGSSGNNFNRLSRFTLSGNVAAPASELVLWQDNVAAIDQHHAGSIVFGNDGKIYFTTGDQFNAFVSQSLTSFQGKVLRINPDGSVPTDNPFFDGNGPNRDAIWALGLRNPFRMTVDRVTGRIYVCDVGSNGGASMEEHNLVVRGANYGWPDCEGICNEPGVTEPMYTYNHGGRDACAVAGVVYRGTQFPSEYYGTYFIADYVQNWVKRITLDANGNMTGLLNFEPANGAPDGPMGDPVKLVEGPDGALYYVDLGFNDLHEPNEAAIRRIRYVIDNQPPVAVANANPTTGSPPLTVNFSSAGSSDPEGQPLTYNWIFGDGNSSTDPNPTHTYNTAGAYVARLTVSDGVSGALSGAMNISVGTPPVATILGPADLSTFRAGDNIVFSGHGSDPDDGELPPSAFTWSIVFHHEGHIHPGGGMTNTTNGTLTIPISGHDYSGATSYEIALSVTDSTGLRNSTSVRVFPEKVNLSFDTVPSGLAVEVDGFRRVTPFVKDTLIGFQHTINAPAQTVGPTSYGFVSWSDGGAANHGITVPANNVSYTATFETTTPPIPPGLVAAYGFNEGAGTQVGDASGNNNAGAIQTATWTAAGKFGQALAFNGTSAMVVVNDSASLDLTTAMTLEAWVYPTSALQRWKDIIYKAADMYYLMGCSETRGGAPALGGTFGTHLYAQGPLPINTWTHLAATYDGARMRFYTNGVEVGNQAETGPIQTSTGALTIGGDNLGGQFWAGRIDEVRIYDRALTAVQIQSDMNTPVGSAPVNQPPVVAASGNPLSGTVPLNVAFSSAGSSDPEGATLTYNWIFGDGNISTAANPSHTYNSAGTYVARLTVSDGVSSATSGDITITANNPVNQPPVAAASGNPLSGVAPLLVAFSSAGSSDPEGQPLTYNWAFGDGGSLTLPNPNHTYQNPGAYQARVTVSDGVNSTTSSVVTVTVNAPGNQPPVVAASGNPLSGAAPLAVTFSSAGSSDPEGVPLTYNWVFGDGNTSTAANPNHTYNAAGNYAARLTVSDGVNSRTSADINITVTTAPSGGLVAAYGFDEGAGTTVGDASGNGNGGNIQGATWIAGRFGQALLFNGASAMVVVNDSASLDLTTAMTLEAWVYRNTSIPAWRDIIFKTSDMYFLMGSSETRGGAPAFGGTFANNLYAQGPVPVNTWTHLAATYDGAVMRFYTNGVQIGSQAQTGTIQTSAAPLTIGGDDVAGQFWSGRIDEVRIYNRALTLAEIQTDMNTPVVSGPAPLALVSAPSARIQRLPDGAVRLEFSVEPGTSYRIDASTDLNQWESLMQSANSDTGFLIFIDMDATRYPRRFYRAIRQ